MQKIVCALVGLIPLFLAQNIASAQATNSTMLVYASTFVPFDSSFAVNADPVTSFATFPPNYKRVDKLALDSKQTVCSKLDTNGDGDFDDLGETVNERFHERYYIGFVVNNRYNEDVTIDSLRYRVEGVSGRTVTSAKGVPTRPVVASAGKDAAVLFRFTDLAPNGRRRFYGHSRLIPHRLTRRRVTYEVTGHSKSRDNIVMWYKDIVGFAELNRCTKK